MTFLYMTLNSIGQAVKLFLEFRRILSGLDLSVGQSSQVWVRVRLFRYSHPKPLVMALYHLSEELDGVG